MPSVTYMNQSAPFWDFVASLEQQGQNHPFFSQNQNDNAERGEEAHSGHPNHPPPPYGPWGWGGFGGRGFPFRGPPPPPGPPPHEESAGENHNENENESEKEKEKDNDNGEGPSGSDEGCARRGGRHGRCGGGRRSDKDGEGASGSDNERGWGRHGRCGGRRGGPHGFGPYGHHGRHGSGPHHGPGHHGPRRGGWGPWARGGPFGGGPFNPLNFAAGLFNPTSTENNNESQDFTPEADIFDTESAFVVHVSLPGAKKEDVGVNWDAEKSELSIAGVIYRPGDEEFLKTLAMDERKVGPFERKVRLGTRANPAQIDVEMITAKLEDGILRVNVPKLETGFVEVRKVDIE